MANNVTDLGKVGITLKGEWSSATNYERLDAVTYEGSLYIAIKDNANVNPGANPTYWLLSAKHGEFTEQQLEDFKAEVVAESKEEMDDYTDDKKAELDTYEGTKETELNTYTGTKKTELDTYAGGLKDDFDSNASTKTTAFNDNATSKTNAFNTNATNKTTDFNDNATAKTTEFNTNASDKTDDFDDNVTAKTTAFDEHVDDKIEEFDENAESLQQEIDELAENMPWAETEQATEINITDAAKYSRNKLELFGNTEQASYTGKNLLPNKATSGTINGLDYTVNSDKSVTINGTSTANTNIDLTTDLKVAAGTYTLSGCPVGGSSSTYRLQLFLSGNSQFDTGTGTTFTLAEETTYTSVRINVPSGVTINNLTFYSQLEVGDTATDYEQYVGGVHAPNPDYPQPIHVVTGNNTIEVTGKNLMNYTNANFIASSTNWFFLDGTPGAYGSNIGDKTNIKTPVTKGTEYTISLNLKTDVLGLSLVYENEAAVATILNSTTIGQKSRTFTSSRDGYIILRVRQTSGEKVEIENIQIEKSSTVTSYEPYYHQDYSLNLGALELCKIGDYQDYLYKENGNWYKYGAIDKYVVNNDLTNNGIDENIIALLTPALNVEGNLSIPNLGAISLCNAFKTTRAGNNDPSQNTGLAGTTTAGRIRIYTSTIYATTYAEAKQLCADNNLTIYFGAKIPVITQITDETLIAQLDAIWEHLQLEKGTNHITVTASDLAPYMKLTYMQDLKSKLDNIDSRLALLE